MMDERLDLFIEMKKQLIKKLKTNNINRTNDIFENEPNKFFSYN